MINKLYLKRKIEIKLIVYKEELILYCDICMYLVLYKILVLYVFLFNFLKKKLFKFFKVVCFFILNIWFCNRFNVFFI